MSNQRTARPRIVPTVWRGLSDVSEFWKTICARRRKSRLASGSTTPPPKFSVPAVLASLGYTTPGYSTTVYGYNLSKLVTHLIWSNDDWSINARGTRWGDEYVAIYGTSDWQRFNAKWTFDLEVSKKLIDKFELSVGANNIFDTYPDRQTYDNTYYGALPYNSVQQGFQGAFYYARIKYSLD